MKACATIVMSMMEEPVNKIYPCGPVHFIAVGPFSLRNYGSDNQAVLGEKLQCDMEH